MTSASVFAACDIEARTDLLDGARTIFAEAEEERGGGATVAAFTLAETTVTGAEMFSAAFTTAEYIDWLSSSATIPTVL
jgi:hypothetical protein